LGGVRSEMQAALLPHHDPRDEQPPVTDIHMQVATWQAPVPTPWVPTFNNLSLPPPDLSLPVMSARASVSIELMRELWREVERVYANRKKGRDVELRDRTRRILSRVYEFLPEEAMELVVLPEVALQADQPGPSSRLTPAEQYNRRNTTTAQRRRIDQDHYVESGPARPMRGHSASATVGSRLGRGIGVKMGPPSSTSLDTSAGSANSNESNSSGLTIINEELREQERSYEEEAQEGKSCDSGTSSDQAISPAGDTSESASAEFMCSLLIAQSYRCGPIRISNCVHSRDNN
jgi:hypothetical protein